MKSFEFENLQQELPLQVVFSLEAMYEHLEKIANDPDHLKYDYAKKTLEKANQTPELRSGVTDFSILDNHLDQIELLTDSLFPETLQNNEIKSVMIPFDFKVLRPSSRFVNILKKAGKDYTLKLKGYDKNNMYFLACTFILGAYYHKNFKYARPMSVEILNKETGIIHQYRILINADFTQIEKAPGTPELTEADIVELLHNTNDIELWKSKFPTNGYIYKGFGLMTLYDATIDTTISETRSLFIRRDVDVFPEFIKNMRTLFGISDLEIGVTVYNPSENAILNTFFEKESRSMIMDQGETGDYRDVFCEGICKMVMKQCQTIAIPDVELYSKKMNQNKFYKKLQKKGIKSIILAPIPLSNGLVEVLEIASPRTHELNSFNALKLQDISPFIKIASNRFIEEDENLLESIIQENYTTIHPTVKWRFLEAAKNFKKQKIAGEEMPQLEEIIFNNIYPIYGQSDIKGSSTARNDAIKADLELQLGWVIETFEKVMAIKPMPIYNNLVFRVKGCLEKVNRGLKAGDELSILGFLKTEIYPVFNHLEKLGGDFQAAVEEYISHIDPTLNVVYKKRKDYDDSVTMLNEQLSAVLDSKQEEAQEVFPHYFQRYNTDGVEYNIYVGGSLIENQTFDKMYLHNLRLWQLETMWDIEQRAREIYYEMPYPLEVASLILVHSNSLAIKFQMDGKQFDVDGAYNARYEIVKKRIDKSYIKGTNERLTQPGKVAIVYSQNEDAVEYLNYIKYLQSEGKYGEVEMLDIEDLQGVSGLKAIRIEVLFKEGKEKIKKKTNRIGQRPLRITEQHMSQQ